MARTTIAQLKEMIDAQNAQIETLTALLAGTPPTPPAPPAKPKKSGKKRQVTPTEKMTLDHKRDMCKGTAVEGTTPWWHTDCEATNAYRELKRVDKTLAKIVRVGCCHDVGLGKFASMKDVKSTCEQHDLDFNAVVAANVEWANEGGDVNELDFA